MNFLTLVQTLRQETAVSSVDPTDVTTVTGDMQRLTDYINLAYQEIQTMEEDWYFMKVVDESLTTTGQTIAVPVDYAEPIALTLTDGTYKDELKWYDRYHFDEKYRTTTFATQRPSEWCVEGSNIKFNTIPDQVYPLKLEYTQTPDVLAINTDTPIFPARWHYMIVYRAMIHWGMFDSANEIVQRGIDGFNRMYGEMSTSQRPQIIAPEALA